MEHHKDDSITEQVNGNIPLKTQQRVEMALSLFPKSDVRVLLADSEVLHEGKIDDPEGFLRAIETSKERVRYKYLEVGASTYFEEAGSREHFEEIRDHFYRRIKEGLGDPKLRQLLEYESVGLRTRLIKRGVRPLPDKETLKQRIMANSFAEFLAIGELLRSVATPSGLCTNVVIYDQSSITGLFNNGPKYGSRLLDGLAPIPLILANSASTV